jgi:hypothetical protein
MTIVFQFETVSIQIIPEKDLCFIWINGSPKWAGNKNELIKILESVHN